MNRKILYYLILFFILIIANSKQLFAQGKFSAGPIIGIGTSSIRGNKQFDIKPHIHAGLLTNYRINDKFNLQSSVVLSTKGYADAMIFPHDNMSLRYLDFIFNIKYFVWEDIFVGAGVQTGIMGYSYYKELYYGTDYYNESNLSGIVNKVDYGISGCVGWQFDNNIGIEISCICGIRNVFNSNSEEQITGEYGDTFFIQNNFKGKNLVSSGSFYYLIGKIK